VNATNLSNVSWLESPFPGKDAARVLAVEMLLGPGNIAQYSRQCCSEMKSCQLI